MAKVFDGNEIKIQFLDQHFVLPNIIDNDILRQIRHTLKHYERQLMQLEYRAFECETMHEEYSDCSTLQYVLQVSLQSQLPYGHFDF